MEMIQMSIDRWMDKQDTVYIYKGVHFIVKRKGNSDTCYNIHEPYAKWKHYAKWN